MSYFVCLLQHWRNDIGAMACNYKKGQRQQLSSMRQRRLHASVKPLRVIGTGAAAYDVDSMCALRSGL